MVFLLTTMARTSALEACSRAQCPRALRAVLLLLSALCLPAGEAWAQTPTLHIPRVSRPPKLEDFLNGTQREAETRVTDFRQFDPGDGVPASQETSAYLSYDDKNLYVVFVCRDKPDQVRAHMAKREDASGDDALAIYFDTFRDRQRVYIFQTNPLGIQTDGILTEGQSPDWNFDTLWYSEGRLTREGFVVWVAIPFKSLRFINAPAQTWGIALGRVIRRKNEVAFWPHITRRVEGFAQQLATLEGLDRISPGRNLQFIPYAALARARFLDTASFRDPAFRSDTDGRAGLDAKVVLRDALTLDLTLNPDFSQVESDDPQVTINQRFEVFFPEKRPFFIENAGFFETRENLFFSRRITDPQFGARLTGKLGRWVVGALAADDRAPGQRLAENDPLHGRRAAIGVVRVRREFGQQSSIGLLATSRDFVSSSNRVFALDGRLKLNPNWVLSGQLMRSYTRALNGPGLAGPAYVANLSHAGRHLQLGTNYLDRSPDFRSQLGFIPRVDMRQLVQHLGYRWRPKQGRLLSFGPGLSALVNWDRQDRLQDWIVRPNFAIELRGQTELAVNHTEAFELFQRRGFRKRTTGLAFSTQRLNWLALSGSYVAGTGINFFPRPGLAPFLADSTSASFGFTLRPTPQFRFAQTYLYSRLLTRESSLLPQIPPLAGIFNNHILRSKLNYQFTRALSLRAIVDYNAVLPNPSLVALRNTKRFTTDFLLTYLVNPGTALYIGFTDGYENLAFIPTVQPILQRTGSPTTSTGRQFFVKMSYLFRF